MFRMADDSPSTERQRNLWAPWRMEYIDALDDRPSMDADGCFLCRYRDAAEDEKNFVLWRSERCFAMLNLFPYTGGHSLVAPLEHVGELGQLDDATMAEMMGHARDLTRALAQAFGAEGFNIGMNVGRCAGAGLPGHLHVHVVPRWGGDTNFMAVLGGVRVIPAGLEEMYARVRAAADELGLPGSGG